MRDWEDHADRGQQLQDTHDSSPTHPRVHPPTNTPINSPSHPPFSASEMRSTLRRKDQLTLIIAPVATGEILLFYQSSTHPFINRPTHPPSTVSEMTATLRRIDQTTLIVAPVATGEIVAYTGLQNGALFIGGWNLCSVALEYFLMWKVFTIVPQLAQKGTSSSESGKDTKPSSFLCLFCNQIPGSNMHCLLLLRPLAIGAGRGAVGAPQMS